MFVLHSDVVRMENKEPPALPRTRIEYRCKCPTASLTSSSPGQKREEASFQRPDLRSCGMRESLYQLGLNYLEALFGWI